MRYNSIAIAGLPKAGKTALIAELNKKLDWEIFHIGGIFRKRHLEWQSKGSSRKEVSFEQYYADKNLVTQQDILDVNELARTKLKEGKIILDTRFPTANAKGLSSVLLVFINAPIETRVNRCLHSKSYESNYEEIKKILLDREEKEAEWGHKTYDSMFEGNFDYRNFKHYNLVLDSSKLTISQELDKILEMLEYPNKKNIIAISGQPGSGSTTVSKILARKTKNKHFSPGQMFKDIASGKLEDQHYYPIFKKLCEEKKIDLSTSPKKNSPISLTSFWETKIGKSSEFHKSIDELQLILAEEGNLVLDGKLSLHMIKNASLKIWLKASEKARAQRTSQRENISLKEAEQTLVARQDKERTEWEKIYGFDYWEQEKEAHLVIDTTLLNPEQVVDKVLNYLQIKDYQKG